MKRLLKPALLYGGIILAVELFCFLSMGMLTLSAAVAVFAASMGFCGLIVGMGMRAVQTFVEGLQAEGMTVEVIEDEMSWWGEHRLKVQTSEGSYRVEGVIGSHIHIRYRGPHTFGWQHVSLFGAHRAGRSRAQQQMRAPEGVGSQPQ